MTEFEARSTHLKTTSNNNHQNTILGLKKANLYSPHVSLKTMNSKSIGHTNNNSNTDDEDDNQQDHQELYATTNPDLDEDIYDFSNVKRNLAAGSSGEQHALNYTDEDDEEDDINFDYEYGYDYERVIKDRLRKANQDFVNDSEPSKRKSIMVSFDTAVTAIDIPNDTRPDSSANEEEKANAAQQKMLAFKATKSVRISDDDQATEDANQHAKKLPLNDTVAKEDPDAFANKIKQAVMRYDSEMLKQQQHLIDQQQTVESNRLNEINDYFRESLTEYSDNSSANYKNDYRDEDFEEDTPSNLNEIKANEMQTQDNNVNKNKDSINSSSPVFNHSTNQTDHMKSSTPSPPPTPQKINSEVPKKNEQPHAEKESVETIEEDEEETIKKVPKQSSNKVPSFSASSKMNEASPSPIASFESSPEPSKSHDNNNNNKPKKATIEEAKPLNESDESTASSSGVSSSEQKSQPNEFQTTTDAKSEKMLVERDGIFKLMSPEEYTAYEKQKQIERQQQKQQQEEQTKKENNTKKLFSLLPHPPSNQRPKTSTYPNRNSAIKNRLITNQQQQPQPIIRYSQSADPNGRRKDLNRLNNQVTINNRRTPDYAQDYKSPYHVQFKSFKPACDIAEEKRRREKEEEERRANNELAFKSWLKLKEEQRAREEHKLKQKQEKLKSEDHSSLNNSDEAHKNTYEYWLIRKQEQLEAEREFKKKLEQLEQQDRKTVTPEERSKAFRDWIARKIREKNEALKLEKLEQKKWMARRRRSRKHQRLSQALELAQAYGYNSSFYSPGFNF